MVQFTSLETMACHICRYNEHCYNEHRYEGDRYCSNYISHMSHCRVIFVVSDKLCGSQGICYTVCEGLFVLHKSGSGFRIQSANLFWADPDLDLGSQGSFPRMVKCETQNDMEEILLFQSL